jgi:DNA primase
MQNKGYSADWLDKLKYNSNIVSTVSRYLTLTRKGNTYWACCPFHHEKTPSFAVNEQGQFYHCFGCGESGDVIKFVQKLEGLDFVDAVKNLAEHAGMEVPEMIADEQTIQKRKHRELLQNICRETAVYYNKTLKSKWGEKGMEYLRGRGVTDSTITKLGIGYSGNTQGLPITLQKLGFKKADILEAGVCGEKDGKLYDEMAMRVVFPVIDHTGKVVGFSGRALSSEAYAKYKNTKGTPLFNKSSNIYCINLLRKARLDKNYAILVEGQMDVVSLQQAGFSNAIATMGTAFNQNHVQTLKRFVDAVIVCFDGDSAGQKATAKSLEPLLEEGFEIKILQLPEKLDPDEYIKKYGSAAYQNLIDNAMPVYEFEIRHEASKLDLTNKDNIPKFIDNCLKIIAGMKKESEKDIYIKLVANISGVTKETIYRQLMSTNVDNLLKDNENQSKYVPESTKTQNYKAEQFVLASILHKKPYASGVEMEDFVNNNFKMLFKYLIENDYPIASKVFDNFDVAENPDIKGVVDFDFGAVKKPEEEFKGCLLKMQLDRLVLEQDELNNQMTKCTNETEKFELLKKVSEISKKIIEKKTLLNKVG